MSVHNRRIKSRLPVFWRRKSHAGGVHDKSELRGSPRGQFRLNEPTLRRLSHAGGVHDKSEFV